VTNPPLLRPDHVIFFGTPAVAVPSLIGLCDARVPVEMVVTGADKRRSRGSTITPSPVKTVAADRGIAVAHDLDEVRVFAQSLSGAVLGVVVAYGRILPSAILDIMPLINLHFSLLPRWRGAAPVERALLAGDSETGVCVMRVREELDAGEVYDCRTIAIEADDTGDSLRERLNHVGVPMLVDACLHGPGSARPQTGEPSYARKIMPVDLFINWVSTTIVSRQVRVGGAYGMVDEKRIKVVECRMSATTSSVVRQRGEVFVADNTVRVCCDDGSIELITVQPEGRPRMAATAWWNGLRRHESVRFHA